MAVAVVVEVAVAAVVVEVAVAACGGDGGGGGGHTPDIVSPDGLEWFGRAEWQRGEVNACRTAVAAT